ncbi:MAG: hypothetical protein H6619_03105 [Deltaproteobacteria bacterium]|nr:hypothetical protein [Deltaproteobacteria bacterium]
MSKENESSNMFDEHVFPKRIAPKAKGTNFEEARSSDTSTKERCQKLLSKLKSLQETIEEVTQHQAFLEITDKKQDVE